jgi:predicted NBD/HSP70 family sugar kinase
MAVSTNATLNNMYAGVDIGGTKTLVAVLDENGVIIESAKFPTPPLYDEFLRQLGETVKAFDTKEYKAGGLAMPVSVFDREHGIGVSFSNLPWKNVPLHNDIEKIFGCPIAVDNDAKLGGLSEAMLLKADYAKVLYITVSTGIGYALIDNLEINEDVGDAGGKPMLFEHDGAMIPWEDFASGHSIVEQYGKKAMDITDEQTWKHISRDLSIGLIELIAVLQPEVIVVGGSVGTYFDRYGDLLNEELRKYELPLLTIPPVIGAKRPEEAVVYGCYDLARQKFGDGQATN